MNYLAIWRHRCRQRESEVGSVHGGRDRRIRGVEILQCRRIHYRRDDLARVAVPPVVGLVTGEIPCRLAGHRSARRVVKRQGESARKRLRRHGGDEQSPGDGGDERQSDGRAHGTAAPPLLIDDLHPLRCGASAARRMECHGSMVLP